MSKRQLKKKHRFRREIVTSNWYCSWKMFEIVKEISSDCKIEQTSTMRSQKIIIHQYRVHWKYTSAPIMVQTVNILFTDILLKDNPISSSCVTFNFLMYISSILLPFLIS